MMMIFFKFLGLITLTVAFCAQWANFMLDVQFGGGENQEVAGLN